MAIAAGQLGLVERARPPRVSAAEKQGIWRKNRPALALAQADRGGIQGALGPPPGPCSSE